MPSAAERAAILTLPSIFYDVLNDLREARRAAAAIARDPARQHGGAATGSIAAAPRA
jgi:hypothetical protein